LYGSRTGATTGMFRLRPLMRGRASKAARSQAEPGTEAGLLKIFGVAEIPENRSFRQSLLGSGV
jgi:hypothetical protein